MYTTYTQRIEVALVRLLRQTGQYCEWLSKSANLARQEALLTVAQALATWLQTQGESPEVEVLLERVEAAEKGAGYAYCLRPDERSRGKWSGYMTASDLVRWAVKRSPSVCHARYCSGFRRDGYPCQNRASFGGDYCRHHEDQDDATLQGRTPEDVMFDARVDGWLAVASRDDEAQLADRINTARRHHALGASRHHRRTSGDRTAR